VTQLLNCTADQPKAFRLGSEWETKPLNSQLAGAQQRRLNASAELAKKWDSDAVMLSAET